MQNARMNENIQPRLVIFGVSNILSDIFDCALANGLALGKVVVHLPERMQERDISVAERLTALEGICTPPSIERLEEFQPAPGELYLLGPTAPARAALATELRERFGLHFHTLVHPAAYVSPLAQLSEGVFVGARSVIGPGVRLAEHVFVNRGVTVGHDTRVGAYSRLQPGCNLGGLSTLGRGVTVAIGATLRERLLVGDNAVIGAGAVVIADVPENSTALGVPASFQPSD